MRFKGGKTETLTTPNPKSSAQQIKTPPNIVQLVDKFLDDHIYAKIADILNEQGFRPGGSAGRGAARLASPLCASPISSIHTRFALATTGFATAAC